MPNYERYEIIGHVGRDAEMRYIPSGQAVTSFSVAVTDQYKNSAGDTVKNTKWIRVSTWGKLAEVCNQYVKKGMAVFVAGKLRGDKNGNPNIFTNQAGQPASSFEMTAQEVRFLSKVESATVHEQANETGGELSPEDDIPF